MSYPMSYRLSLLVPFFLLLVVSMASGQEDAETLFAEYRAASANRVKANFFRFIKSSGILKKRIHLSSDQKEKLQGLEREYAKQARENLRWNNSTKFLSETHSDIAAAKRTEKSLLEFYTRFRESVLTNEQSREFHKEFLVFRMRQTPYLYELTDPLVAKELGLSKKQLEQINELAKNELIQIQEKRVEVARQWFDSLRNVFLDHQKQILDSEFGSPPKTILTMLSKFLDR